MSRTEESSPQAAPSRDNVAHHLWRQARERPGQPALRHDSQTWTYAELYADARRYGDAVADRGVRAGDRVMLVCPTSGSFVVAYYALLSLGAVVVTVNPASTARELRHVADDAQCRLIVTEPAHGAAARVAEELSVGLMALPDTRERAPVDSREPAGVAPQDLAALLYTSGTTGNPKGAELTHINLVSSSEAFRTALQITDDDRVGTALPLFHVFGQVVIMGTTFIAGARLSIQSPFSASGLLRAAADEALTVLAGVPTMWNAMLHSSEPVHASDVRLRLAISGGAALPLAVCHEFARRFGCTILGGYGLTETAGAATFNRPTGLTKDGSVGDALPGMRVAVHDDEGGPVAVGEVGEVVLRGPTVLRGYWRRPEETAAAFRDGWFLTGDLGRLDDDGYLWIVDRKKDLIIRGGYNVYPKEVEEVLYQHPKVLEAAVIGLADDHLGEEICAVVVPVDDAQIDPAELSSWLGERLSAYKVPRIYRLVGALPKGPTGKILKRGIHPAHLAQDDVTVTI